MREKPGFEPDSPQAQQQTQGSPSCFGMLLVTVVGYFVFSALSRTTLAGFASETDRYICYGTLLGFVVLLILADRDAKKTKRKLHEARQELKRTGRSAELAILDRSGHPGGTSWEDEYGIPHSSRASYHLDLELSPDQKAVQPDRERVYVQVSVSVYTQLLERDTVRIYYRAEEPFAFLLEEEIG